MERVLRYLTREMGGLHEAAFLLGFFALVSQIVGLFRDRLLASMFGAGQDLDIYYAAFRVPDFLYVTIASCVASTALIPILLDRQRDGNLEDFVRRIFTTFSFAMIVIGTMVAFMMPSFAKALVPGFSEAARADYVSLARILLLSPLFLGLSNLLGSITQAHRRFFAYALAPVLYNLGIIGGIVFLVPRFGLIGLALGVVLGAVLHALSQMPAAFSLKYRISISRLMTFGELRELLTISLPRTIGLAVHQIAMTVLIGLASQIEAGSIAIFTLATNLNNIPLMIIGSSYAVAAFPTLARLYGTGESEQFLAQLMKAVRHIVFWSAPAIVLFIVLRAQIVRSVLGAGAFDWTATRLVAASLALLALSLVPHSLVLLFSRGYYAMGNTRLPLYANTTGAFAMIALSTLTLWGYRTFDTFRFFIEDIFRVYDISGTALLMLPLSYSLGMAISMTWYYLHIRRVFPGAAGQTHRTILHAGASSVFAGYVSYHALAVLSPIIDTERLIGVVTQGVAAATVGMIGWLAILLLLKNAELAESIQAFRTRLWKGARPITSEQEEL